MSGMSAAPDSEHVLQVGVLAVEELHWKVFRASGELPGASKW